MSLRPAAQELLVQLTADPGSTFRAGQWEAIEALVERRRRVLVVQRTGWGKSAVYFLATRLLRNRGAGPTVLISPLLALMRNQILMAERAGVRAITIHSGNRHEWEQVEAEIRSGTVDLLLISPERLNNPRFRREVLPDLVGTVGLLVVDEAHCISDWGHDFRPDYRRIAAVLGRLPAGVPVLCTTATANDRVVTDIVSQLGHQLEVIRGPLDRESLSLAVVDLPEQARRMAWLATVIPTLSGSGIVYCLTIADTERVAGWLRSRGIDALAYTGQSDAEDRIGAEEALLANRVKVVVATSALGMGFDKGDLPFVIHYQSPGSPIAYYQQVGRAGRAVTEAVGVLLRGHEDTDIQDHFIATAFPPRDQAEAVIGLLEARGGPVKITEIEGEVNARRTRIEAMLKVLEVDGAVERTDGGWVRSEEPWAYDSDRVERVTGRRRAEQRAMVAYAAGEGCRMTFLRGELDDPAVAPCGRCDNCTGRRWDVALDPAVVAAAVARIRSAVLELEPRRRWPAGLTRVKGKISDEEQLMPGRALGAFGDGGWGAVVKEARDAGGPYPAAVVDAAVACVRGWRPEPAPAWVTWVPSASHPGPVPDLARRLAGALDLEARDVIGRVRARPPQRHMANSAQQVSNVLGGFEVTGEVPPAPVLLVDDTADSRWTLTMVGGLLAGAGAGPVHPFVLARTQGG